MKKGETKTNGKVAKKLSYEEFFRKGIINLRKPPYKGIHAVYSGFNKAFKDYYGTEGPTVREAQEELIAEGKLSVRFVKGGVMFYLPEDAPAERNDALDVILNGKRRTKK
jgi:hypothetical protein